MGCNSGFPAASGGGGGVGGSGAAGQVAFWVGPVTLAGSPNLVWSGAALGILGDLAVSGVAAANNFLATGPAATVRDQFQMQTAFVNRFIFRLDAAPEVGGDAGSNFSLQARSDAGGLIDSPITIARAAGGGMILGGAARPITMNGAASIAGALSVTGIVTTASRINVAGAVDTANYSVNVLTGYVATSNTFGYQAFGLGNPSVPNREWIEFYHNGPAQAFIDVSRAGTGGFRDLIVRTSAAERLRIAAAGLVSVTGDLSVSGITSSGLTLLGGAINPGDGSCLLVANGAHVAVYGAAQGFQAFGIGRPGISPHAEVRLYHDGVESVLESRSSAGPIELWLVTNALPRMVIGGAGTITFPPLVGSGTTTATLDVNGKLGRTTALALTGTNQVVMTTAGTDINSGFILESILPFQAWHETDAAANQGWWAAGAQADRFRLVAIDDAGTTANDVFTVDRIGALPSLLRLVPTVNTVELLATAPSTALRSGFRIPPGVAPAVPVDGDMWYDSGTNQIKVRLNGVTRRLQDLP